MLARAICNNNFLSALLRFMFASSPRDGGGAHHKPPAARISVKMSKDLNGKNEKLFMGQFGNPEPAAGFSILKVSNQDLPGMSMANRLKAAQWLAFPLPGGQGPDKVK
jgi:hypothetical protein